MEISSRKRAVVGTLVVLAVGLSAIGCSKKAETVPTPSAPAVLNPPAVESTMMAPPSTVPSMGAPPANGITAAMVVDAMGTKAQQDFCTGYAALNDEQAALAAFMSGYKKNTTPSGEEVFAELVSRC